MMTLTRNNFPIFIILLVCAATLGSCDDKEFINPGGKAISFSVADTGFPEDTDGTRSTARKKSGKSLVLTDEAATDTLYMFTTIIDTIVPHQDETRGKLINSTSDLKNFQVFAQIKTSEPNAEWNTSFFMNEKATESGGVWRTENTYYWPGANYKLRFFAIHPTTLAPKNTSPITLEYTVPEKAKEQSDLMIGIHPEGVGKEFSGNNNDAVSLEFEHLCTAIKFKFAEDMDRTAITAIRLKGIYTEADYELGGDWSEEKSVTREYVGTTFPSENTDFTDVPDGFLTGDNHTFMMIPQKLPTDATIEIVYEGKTLTANVGGQVWDKSTTVVYNISVTNWDYTFEVTPINTVFAHTGETSTELFSVISYKKDADNPSGDEIPVNCEVEVLTDDEEWVTVSEPSVVDYTYTYSGAVAAQTKSVAFDPADILKKMPAKGSENNPYNLSNSTGSNEVQNTANCYVVNAPGTYSFPLVYGNAIKGGMDNVDAYTTSNSGTKILETFVNHKDEPIQNPYIKDNADCVPDDVALVWQDAEGLVDADNIRLIDCSTGNIATENTASQNYRVVFEVPQTTIKPGNAVIAVRSGNTILWSWHIWVTDYVLGTDLKRVKSNLTGGGGTYELMPYNLGWCGEATTGFAIRGLKLRISQPGSGNSKEINLTQSGILSKKGNNPFYQWGRKDPMLPGKGDGTTTDKDYFSKANYTFLKTSASVTIGTSIQNPFTFYGNISKWCDSEFHNLWSVGQSNSTDITTKISIKGVYDPCPIGFKVPPVDTFCAFTVDGQTANNAPEKIKGSFNASLNGWGFEAQNSSVFLPITYLRDKETGNLLATLSANYWAALFKKALGLNATAVMPQGSSYHAAGNTIRPIKE